MYLNHLEKLHHLHICNNPNTVSPKRELEDRARHGSCCQNSGLPGMLMLARVIPCLHPLSSISWHELLDLHVRGTTITTCDTTIPAFSLYSASVPRIARRGQTAPWRKFSETYCLKLMLTKKQAAEEMLATQSKVHNCLSYHPLRGDCRS